MGKELSALEKIERDEMTREYEKERDYSGKFRVSDGRA
jgi:hypothetical protein